MFSNPVLRREFVTSLRTRLAAFLAAAFLLSMAGLVLLMWPRGGVYSRAAQSSHSLFTVLSMAFLALVALCAPSFTAVSITGEKERETYDLLYDTMLRPWDIVLGKFVAGVGFVMLLVAGSLPMLGACLVLGGVSFTGDVLPVYAIAVAAGTLFGLLGLWCSAVFRGSYRALVMCYLFILSLCGLTWVPAIIIDGFGSTINHTHFVRAFSPFAAMLSVVHPGFFREEHPVAPPPGSYGAIADGPWVFLIFAGAACAALLLLTLRVVARPPQPKRRGAEALIDEQQELLKRAVKFPFYLIDPRKRKKMMGGRLNIIAVKEMRQKAFGRMTWVLRFIWAGLVASMIMAFLPLGNTSRVGFDNIVFICLSMPLAVIILIGPVLTASAVSDERESGVFDMLRATPVSPWTFVLGKLEVAWFFTLALVASTLPTFFVLAYVSRPPDDMAHISDGVNLIRPFNFDFAGGWAEFSKVNPAFLWDMLAAFAVIASGMFFATVFGVFASSICRRSSVATALAYGAVALWAVGTLVPYFLAGSLPEWVVRLSLMLNPFAAAAKAVRQGALPGYAFAWTSHIYIMAGVSLALLAATVTRVWLMMRPSR